MTTVQMMLRDTDDGLVDVEITVTGYDKTSNAQALAERLCSYMAELTKEQMAMAPVDTSKLYCGKEFLASARKQIVVTS